LQQRLCGALYQLGADRIYASNANRTYCSRHQIATSFVPKGKEGRKADQKASMRAVLSKVRSTHLEGSFGNEKNHYGLQHIKAKTEATEKVWIFFSVLTANAVQIAKLMQAAAKGTRAA
jgi:transposase, IS5 family